MAWEFKKWYEGNKAVLSEKRKKRYREDPAYRQQVKDRAASRRASLKKTKTPANGMSASEVCDILEISRWTLNRWKNEKYFPVYVLDGHGFTQNQVQLLTLLKQFFSQYPKKAASANQEKLTDIVSAIHHNWG